MRKHPSKIQLVLAIVAVSLAVISVGVRANSAKALSHAVLLTVPDQRAANGTVTIADVFSHEPGYVVVYGVYHGSPTHVIGYASVPAGWSYNVQVPITMSRPITTAYAILHNDTGRIGTYETSLDGAMDAPELMDGTPITVSFKIYYPPSRR